MTVKPEKVNEIMYFESLQKESTEEIIKETTGEIFQELKEDR